MHNKKASPSTTAATAAPADGCPVVGAQSANGADFSALLNPLNRMPANAQQHKGVGQTGELSKDRVESTIPKGDGESKWVYPSPQMFYNALVKKGKAADVDERTMDSVVAIHNNMNEKTWKRVPEWEGKHCTTCETPRKLVRFVGKPDELSPKAMLKYYLGLAPRPFDRHDWTVDRCGTEVRYIIDYYDVAEKRGADRLPSLHEEDAVPSIYCDVRPAGDSVGELYDRACELLPAAMSFVTSKATVTAQGAPEESSGASSPAKMAAATAEVPTLTEAQVADAVAAQERVADAVRNGCAERMQQLAACQSEAECAHAHIGLTLCVAKHVCQNEARAFEALKGKADGNEREAGLRFGAMEECVARWGQQASGGAGQ